ncbi:MAG TPA: CBS domain-containing protein [Symbiobacteriaceae bacterium]|nr:CBS domain-containing protein [Symbiobacteriaceae bacterium]
MIVRSVMIEDVTTVLPDDTLQHAYDVIQTKRYECLPVKDANSCLVGIIQLIDIFEACMKEGRQVALPRKVKEVMVTNIVTITPDELIERAAKIMQQRDIPLLPVVEDCVLKGVIHESDLFKAMSEMLGVDSNTTRLTLIVPDRKGQLARIAEIIRDAGVSITHVATFHSKVLEQYKVVVRVETESARPLVELLEQHGYKVINVTVD